MRQDVFAYEMQLFNYLFIVLERRWRSACQGWPMFSQAHCFSKSAIDGFLSSIDWRNVREKNRRTIAVAYCRKRETLNELKDLFPLLVSRVWNVVLEKQFHSPRERESKKKTISSLWRCEGSCRARVSSTFLHRQNGAQLRLSQNGELVEHGYAEYFLVWLMQMQRSFVQQVGHAVKRERECLTEREGFCVITMMRHRSLWASADTLLNSECPSKVRWWCFCWASLYARSRCMLSSGEASAFSVYFMCDNHTSIATPTDCRWYAGKYQCEITGRWWQWAMNFQGSSTLVSPLSPSQKWRGSGKSYLVSGCVFSVKSKARTKKKRKKWRRRKRETSTKEEKREGEKKHARYTFTGEFRRYLLLHETHRQLFNSPFF